MKKIIRYIISNFVGFIANLVLEQELRKEFILLSIMKAELEQQHYNQETVKLLLNNILPPQICRRFVTDC